MEELSGIKKWCRWQKKKTVDSPPMLVADNPLTSFDLPRLVAEQLTQKQQTLQRQAPEDESISDDGTTRTTQGGE
jgi:hypothetical protein